MAVYDTHDHETGRRVTTMRRTEFDGVWRRFASSYGKHREKLLPDARKLWRGKSGKRPVTVRRNGEVIRQIFIS